jgi:hypothetical protein
VRTQPKRIAGSAFRFSGRNPDKPLPPSFGCGGAAVVNAELRENRGDVFGCRPARNEEPIGNLAIGQSPRQKPEHL